MMQMTQEELSLEDQLKALVEEAAQVSDETIRQDLQRQIDMLKKEVYSQKPSKIKDKLKLSQFMPLIYAGETSAASFLYNMILEKHNLLEPTYSYFLEHYYREAPLGAIFSPFIFGGLTSIVMSISRAIVDKECDLLEETMIGGITSAFAAAIGAGIGYLLGEDTGYILGAGIATYLSRLAKDNIPMKV